MASSSSIYFDKSDEVILHLVNRIIDSRSISSEPVLEPHLHPHGIKELVDTPVARMAYAVANLLRNLESGGVQARDRLLGLQVLYDEVLSSAHTTLRRNTARVLMQIMKSIVRAHGKEQRQLKLAHDFRAAAQGTPRIVRRLLKRYHLPEMDESWNQIAFDDHVYDMNTKGRKSPTHLIMDAWIKGIKTLTVIYDNCVSIEAAREILSAAAIVGISVRIGLEFRVPFRGRFIDVLWAPRGFSSNEDFLEFLASDKMRAFSDKGRDVVNWEREMVLQILAVWNDVLRPRYASKYAIEIPPLGADDFLNFLGRGHASVPRLAECLFKLVRSSIDARAQALAKLPASAQTEEVLKQKASLEGISSDTIQDEWLNPDLHPELPQLSIPEDLDRLPELRRLSPYELMKELAKVNAGYRMVLCTTGLSVQDVMELLWDCKGMITHLEIFSMRGWMDGLMPDIHEIGELQVALNSGQGPRLKQMVRQMIRDMQESGNEERRAKFEQILHAIPTLWEHYRHSPLKSRIGTGSSSRARSFGMGLVVTDTLPARGVKMLEKRNPSPVIPVWAPVEEHVISREPEGSDSKGSDSKGSWLKSLSWLPGLSRFGRERRKEWVSPRDSMSVSQHGNIANLGGLASNSGAPIEDMEEGGRSPG
ncbi:MAG: hypothetical protein II515_03595, partial [Desulfovibrio sp.]|nr:hypothetical protein [Desulfovibrio sp.]